MYHFNTSHGNVNHDVFDSKGYLENNFNTSHVNVNLTNLSLIQLCLNLSLPILSHFSKNYQPYNLIIKLYPICLKLQVFTGFLEDFFISRLVNIFII